jgi:serine/threonine protein kinase
MRQDPVLTLSTKFYLFYQLALGIKFLVDKQVQHNDLKPGNILVSKTNIIKIIDFGEATHPRLAIGNPGRTMPYTSPEAFDHNKSSPFNPRHDIFALGVIVYEMIFDQYPVDYRRSKIKLLEDKYKTKKIPFQTD